jgi:hypothetical protein
VDSLQAAGQLTFSFSENFKAAIGLDLAYYSFVKTHGSFRDTSAIAAGIAQSHWTVEGFLDAV